MLRSFFAICSSVLLLLVAASASPLASGDVRLRTGDAAVPRPLAILSENEAAAGDPVVPPAVLAKPVIEPVRSLPNSLEMKWTRDPLADWYTLYYSLNYRLAGETEWVDARVNVGYGEDNAYFYGLPPNTEYEFRAKARTRDSESEWSDIFVMRTQPLAPVITFTFNKAVGLGFRLEFDITGNPDSVIVERCTRSSSWSWMATLPGTATSYSDSAIEFDTEYLYRLTAVRGEVTSVKSAGAWVVVYQPTLTLGTLKEENQNVIISGSSTNPAFFIKLQRRLEGEVDWADLATFAGSTFNYSDTGTAANTTYEYRLKAGLEDLSSRTSATVSFKTGSLTLAKKAPWLGFAHIASSQITLNWADAGREDGYRLERHSGADTAWTQIASLGPDVTAYTDTTVVAGQRYRYRLIPFNALGDGPPSLTVLAKAEVPAVAVEDDFDPEVDAAQWTSTSPAASVDGGAGFNGSKALWFGHAGPRVAQTRTLDASGGGWVEFSLRAGNAARDGSASWDNSEPGDSVVLEYSREGGAWHVLRVLDTAYPLFSDWADVVVALPEEACKADVSLRWRQQRHDGAGLDAWALDRVKIWAAPADLLEIVSQPKSVLVMEGGPASLEIAVNRPAATFQWFKDSVAIPGATGSIHSVAGMLPQNGGRYHAEVYYAGITLQTAPAVMVVLQRTGASASQVVPAGGSFSLGVQVHPVSLQNELSFLWSRVPEGHLQGIGVMSGDTSPVLTVTSVTEAAQSVYRCRVSHDSGYFGYAGPYEVRVPQVPRILPVPDTRLTAGAPVDIAIQVTDPEANVQVAGLPKGLRYDAVSRRIQGSLAAPQKLTVTVEALNSLGWATPVSFVLEVVPFPSVLAGTYRGAVPDPAANATDAALRHGAAVTCQLSGTGAASGTVMIRGKSFRFASAASAVPGSKQARITASFKDAEKRDLVVVLDISDGEPLHPVSVGKRTSTSTGNGTEAATEVEVLALGHAVRNDWTAAKPAPWAGSLNTLTSAQVAAVFPNPDKPQGTGFLNLTLSPRGVVACKGRLSDGQVVTASTIMGPGGDIPVFVNLYAGKGSWGALLSLSFNDRAVSGTALWGKDDLGATSKDRVHKRGFDRHALQVRGGAYVKPAVNTPLLPSMTALPAPASLRLTGAGLLPVLGQDFSVNGRHQAVVAKPGTLNPQGFTLSLNAATGLFTGSFKLADENPAKAGQILRRTVSFQGALIPGQDKGAGYFLLPELPSATVKGSSLSNTPVWSGSVELLPGWLQN
ncbi:MAG TPA: fibronectin type III domain-containing protein [Prosthecobacter sp.]